MYRTLAILTVAASALTLSACGGGGSSDSAAPTAPTITTSDYVGVWTGTATGASTAQATMLVRPDGTTWLLGVNQAANAVSFSVGKAAYSLGALTLTSTGYAVTVPGSAPFQTEAKLIGAPKATVTGTGRVTGTTADSTATLTYDVAFSAKTMAIADAVGSYSGIVIGTGTSGIAFNSFTVGTNGNFAGLLANGCKVSGALTVNGSVLDMTTTTDAATCGGVRASSGIAVFDGKIGLMAFVSADKTLGAVVTLTKN